MQIFIQGLDICLNVATVSSILCFFLLKDDVEEMILRRQILKIVAFFYLACFQ